ncbi:Ankyrin repeat-containing domain protein [Rutstroemia sp. NJR-2017a BBW]|nr:Ankyrin repeat-containing domain protein [Rutstroemia sp. NJR-2017a BBW]
MADDKGRTALYFACQKGNIALVELLLGKGADVGGKSSEWNIPLYLACKRGYNSIVKVLLENGAKPNYKNGEMHGPLYYAVRNKHIDVVKILLERGTEPLAISASRAVVSPNQRDWCSTSEQILQLLKEAHSQNLLQDVTKSHQIIHRNGL